VSHPHPELGPPPALPEGGLRVVALGGLGEVGRNMTVLEYAGRLLVVDCGVLFPEDFQPGVDLILPTSTPSGTGSTRSRASSDARPRGPHRRGALPAAREAGHPAHRLAADPRAGRVEAAGAPDQALHLEVREGQRERLGPFDCEFVAVNHSIPDALAVAVRTPAGTLLHTGDFKLDQLPLDGRITDLRRFARIGEEGVDLFLVDSTNAEVPGFTTPSATSLR
jgi:ribonuclease J